MDTNGPQKFLKSTFCKPNKSKQRANAQKLFCQMTNCMNMRLISLSHQLSNTQKVISQGHIILVISVNVKSRRKNHMCKSVNIFLKEGA